MSPTSAESRCSGGETLDFYWHATPGLANESAVDAAVTALISALKCAGRLWNPWSESMAKAEFRDRLNVARSGGLIPVDHVKLIHRARDEHLFEIRWSIGVLERQASGMQRAYDVELRLYHTEPSNFLDIFVGLHAHEKDFGTTELETRDMQNSEIDIAVARYWTLRNARWGVP